MRIVSVTLLLLAFSSASNLQAQNVTCESKGKARAECPMDTQGEVVLVRQLSKAACKEGVTWGLSKHAVWVEGGCRGEFSNRTASAAPAQSASRAGIPLLNASCPTGLDVHADEGGPVYVNGKETSLKRFNDNYFEAKDTSTGTTISLSRSPDGTMSVSYTGRGGANGVCTLK